MPDMFQFVGISFYKNGYKVRFANSASRARILERYGHQDVRLVDLGMQMSKVDAVLAIRHLDIFSDLAAQTALDEFLAVDEERATKSAVSKSTRAPKVRRKTIEGIDPDDEILALARSVAARDSANSSANFVTETIDPDDEILALARSVAARELVVVDDEDEPF